MTSGKPRDQLVAEVERLRKQLAQAEQALALAVADLDQPISPEPAELLRQLPGIVISIDLHKRQVIYVNAAVTKLLDYTPAEIVALGDRVVPELLHGDDLPRIETFLRSLAHATHWLTTEFRVRDRVGSWHWLMVRGTAIEHDSLGRARIVLGSALEITQRKAAEETLRQSEERHRVLADTMLQGVVHQDASGFIISMNLAAERILGKSREQFLGSTSEKEQKDTIREDGSVFPGSEHPSMIALRTGKTVRGVVMGVWNPKQEMYRWIRIDSVPVIRGEDLNPIEVYAVFEDITEVKQHHEQLTAFHQKLVNLMHC